MSLADRLYTLSANIYYIYYICHWQGGCSVSGDGSPGGHRAPVTGHRAPVTPHRAPVTAHRARVTGQSPGGYYIYI